MCQCDTTTMAPGQSPLLIDPDIDPQPIDRKEEQMLRKVHSTRSAVTLGFGEDTHSFHCKV